MRYIIGIINMLYIL